MQIAEFLKESEIFLNVVESEILTLAERASILRFRKNDVIIREGEIPPALFIIYQGRVKVFVESISGKETILDIRTKGEMFVEGPSLDEKPCTPTVQALEDTEIISIKRDDFVSFLLRNPKVALRLLYIWTEKTRNVYRKVKDLAMATASERLIRVILALSKKYGDALPFSHREISDMSGIAIETSSRIMTRLKKSGLIQIGRNRIVVIDRCRLESLV